MKTPIVRITGQSGTDLIPKWKSLLESVTYTDNEGGEADELEITFVVAPPFPAPPPKGTRYVLEYGWAKERLRNAGVFTYQNSGLNKSAGDAWTMTITARSADFVEGDKSADLEHYDNTTAGKIFEKLAAEAGKSAVVDDDIAKVEIPYRLRLNQSAIGFGQALADEVGGSLKLAGGKWIVTAKSSGRTATGNALPAIVISPDIVFDAGLTSEGRPEYGTVAAGYFDEDAGAWVEEKTSGKGKSSRTSMLHPSPSSAEAKVRSKTQATDLARATVAGSLTIEGDVDAMAGAPLSLPGFGQWAGSTLSAGSISHAFTFDESGGWLMTVEIAAKDT
ncbi:phage late control D family protein [Agrobacterium salinitolerans]|uniref:phage late control D family protein n=1 Tax=Agrobacterium salinitolerans TaxID=1183413 RepID=UPI0035B34C4C